MVQSMKANEKMQCVMGRAPKFGLMVVNILVNGLDFLKLFFLQKINNIYYRQEDKANGIGKLFHADGDIYEGE